MIIILNVYCIFIRCYKLIARNVEFFVLIITHRLISWLRNLMAQQRLTCLTRMVKSIYCGSTTDVDKVINRFSKFKGNIELVIAFE